MRQALFFLLTCFLSSAHAGLPLASRNGDYRDPAIRVIHRAGDTVDAAWQDRAYQLPVSCDTTLVSGSMTSLQNAINDTGNQVICVSPGANLGTGAANITRSSSCSSPIWIIPSDYADHDPADMTVHPARQSTGDQAQVGRFNLNGSGDCMFIFYRLVMNENDPNDYSPAVSCNGNPNNFIASHVLSRGTISNENCRATRHSLHYSFVTTTTPTRRRDKDCARLGNGSGGMGATEGMWVTHNEFRDCAGDGAVATQNDFVQDGGYVIAANRMEITPALYTDCRGTITNDPDAFCSGAEGAIDLKVGNRNDTIAEGIRVQRNIVSGYRLNDREVGGSGGGQTPAMDIQRDTKGALITGNVFYDIHLAMLGGAVAGIKPNTPGNISVNNNIFVLRRFDYEPANLPCGGGNFEVNCDAFNKGFDFSRQRQTQMAFNTIKWEVGTPAVRWVVFNSQTHELLGNVVINGDNIGGSPQTGSNLGCNAYMNSASLGDPDSYSGDIQLQDYTFWVDEITDPKQVTLPDVFVVRTQPALVDLCEDINTISSFGANDPELTN